MRFLTIVKFTYFEIKNSIYYFSIALFSETIFKYLDEKILI